MNRRSKLIFHRLSLIDADFTVISGDNAPPKPCVRKMRRALRGSGVGNGSAKRALTRRVPSVGCCTVNATANFPPEENSNSADSSPCRTVNPVPCTSNSSDAEITLRAKSGSQHTLSMQGFGVSVGVTFTGSNPSATALRIVGYMTASISSLWRFLSNSPSSLSNDPRMTGRNLQNPISMTHGLSAISSRTVCMS